MRSADTACCIGVLFASGACVSKATPNDYVYLGCVADQDDSFYNPKQDRYQTGTPGLPSLLLMYSGRYMNVTTCASAAKRAGKRFFGFQQDTCRAGPSLISALRHSARPGVCKPQCARGYVCKFPLATALYVFKTGKGELWMVAAWVSRLSACVQWMRAVFKLLYAACRQAHKRCNVHLADNPCSALRCRFANAEAQ
jgi:hypothetical protein